MPTITHNRLNRLAEAEEKGSTAAGAIGVNGLLRDFYRQSEAKKTSSSTIKTAAKNTYVVRKNT